MFVKNKFDCFYLEFLVVSPDSQRLGIGRKLTLGIRELWQEDIQLSLDTREFNEVAQRFYEALGFQRTKSSREGYISYQLAFPDPHSPTL
jgi:ribosomal protein S18 acetylase RimI-like enzyme